MNQTVSSYHAQCYKNKETWCSLWNVMLGRGQKEELLMICLVCWNAGRWNGLRVHSGQRRSEWSDTQHGGHWIHEAFINDCMCCSPNSEISTSLPYKMYKATRISKLTERCLCGNLKWKRSVTCRSHTVYAYPFFITHWTSTRPPSRVIEYIPLTLDDRATHAQSEHPVLKKNKSGMIIHRYLNNNKEIYWNWGIITYM